MIWKVFQMGTSRDRSYLGQLLIKKKSFWIPIEEDLRDFFLQLVFFYLACGPRKAMHYEGTGGVEFKISRFLSRISPKRWEIEIRSLRH
jgi:hypothetical protein